MNKDLNEEEIDEIIISEADKDGAWEQPIRVNRKKSFSLSLVTTTEIVSDKDILSGTPVFRGTDVPVSALLENLENGASLGEFLTNFPSVKREQAIQVLECFKSTLDNLKRAA